MQSLSKEHDLRPAQRIVGAVSLVLTVVVTAPVSASAEGLFTKANAHKVLGFTTVALAGATAASSGEVDAHESLAYATAACALSTAVLGLWEHGSRFDLSDGLFTKDNIHIMLGTAGAAMLTAGVVMAARSLEEKAGGGHDVDKTHVGLASAGAIMMTVAVITIEF